MKEALSVTVEKVKFSSDESGFCVFVFRSGSGADEITGTAAGVLPGVSAGRRYDLEGEWRMHPKYGSQFSFAGFAEAEPEDELSIESFLASGVVKGVGPSLARAIVRKFGSECLEIIRDHPERLTEVPGIGRKKAAAIIESYGEHRGYADTVMALSPLGISSGVCMKLYRQYGADAARVIRDNPYRLMEEVSGIGFARADKIAEKLGIAKDAPMRIQGGIVAGLARITDEGSTFALEKEFVEEIAQVLDVEREKLEDELLQLIMAGLIMREDMDGRLVLMPMNLYEAEQDVAGALWHLSNASLSHVSHNAGPIIAARQESSGIALSEQQKEAVMLALSSGVCVITGGPGTGKTTIINTILSVLNASGIRTALAAGYRPVSLLMEKKYFTGQAADIAEACRDVPVYTASGDVLTELTGFRLTQGVLCAMHRREPMLSRQA